MSGRDRDDPDFGKTAPNIRINKRRRDAEETPEDFGATRRLDNVRPVAPPPRIASDERDENVDYGATRQLSRPGAARGDFEDETPPRQSRARISQRRREPAYTDEARGAGRGGGYAPVDTSQRYGRAEAAQPDAVPVPTQSVLPPPPRPARPVPLWLTLAGTVMLLGIVALFTVLYLLLPYPGFNLIVKGAPMGSTVLVDNTARGATSSSGDIVVRGLRANDSRNVRVVYNGQVYFDDTVMGEDGVDRTITVGMPVATATPQPQTGPPREIMYGYSRMFFVPAGTFIMGDNNDPTARPAHEVNVADFYLDEHEVTNAQYARFCQETGRQPPMNPFWSPNYFTQFPNAPVVGVTYADAEAYAQWAGKRLPTEEEWEKAASWNMSAPENARKRQWPWGNSFGNILRLLQPQPMNVGQYPAGGASPYGMRGMAGNASEWVNAAFEPYQGNSATGGGSRAAVEEECRGVQDFGTGRRVTRGGSFRAPTSDILRTTRRDCADPSFTTTQQSNERRITSLIGFRCAVSLNDERLQQHLRSTGAQGTSR
jgi:formylglycine-generating enzyme required for sulfatase activity